MGNNKLLIILIVTFILIAVILSFAIYKQRSYETDDILFQRRFLSDTSPDSIADNSPKPTPTQSGDNLDELSIEELESLVLDPPEKYASNEEKERHFSIVQRIAKSAEYLDITKCNVASPVVFKVKDGEAFIVKNDSSVEHTISIHDNQIFSIAAHSTKSIQPDFKIGAGVYGYGCDSSPREVGMLLVI